MAASNARQIRLSAGSVSMPGELNDSETANHIWKALPIVGKAQVWGDEIYFPIAVKRGEENGQRDVPRGTLAYWPPGHSFCIFFGQRPYSAVNVVGRLLGEPNDWKQVADGAEVRIEASEGTER
jgi:hypothetical protein